MQFSGNAYIFSAYPIKTQSTTVTLATSTIESFSRVAPTSTSTNEITYGPYSDMAPYSSARVTIHFENNGPFLMVASLDRLLEISHWGNIAVEEHVHVKHTGLSSYLYVCIYFPMPLLSPPLPPSPPPPSPPITSPPLTCSSQVLC